VVQCHFVVDALFSVLSVDSRATIRSCATVWIVYVSSDAHLHRPNHECLHPSGLYYRGLSGNQDDPLPEGDETKPHEHVFPYVMSSISFLGAFMLLRDPLDVERTSSHMFCHVKSPGPATLTGILCVVPLVIALVLEAWAAILLVRHWSTFRRVLRCNSDSPVTVSILVRILVFTAVPVTGISLTITSIVSPSANVDETTWDVLLLTLPILAALAFGTRRDILRGWLFWRKDRTGAGVYKSEV